jgi:hypothetical protein
MFLEVMADTGNIGGYFGTMREPDTGHLAEGRIRLFGGNCHYPGTNPPLLRTRLKSRRLGLGSDLLPSKTNQLINSRHELKTPPKLQNKAKGLNIAKRKKRVKYLCQGTTENTSV